MFWRLLFRSWRLAGRSSTVPDWVRGGIGGRRREAAMLIPRIVAWKLNVLKVSFAVRTHDTRNAFGSVSHHALAADERAVARPSELAFFLQRRFESRACFDLVGGPLALQPGEGGLMRHSNQPWAFMSTAYRLFSAWLAESSVGSSERLTFQCGVLGVSATASVVCFVDDIFRTIALPHR